jgi:Trypsin-like peptidase domain
MRGRTSILVVVLLCALQSRLEASCVAPGRLSHSAVGITRHFDDAERSARPSAIGVSASAWFLSPTTIVTAEHVSAGMLLTAPDWKPIEIRDGEDTATIPARIQRITGRGPEKLAVIELQHAFAGARIAAIRAPPLTPDDQVLTIAHPNGRPRVIGGRFVTYGDEGTFAGAALLEMFDGDDRLAVDYGASGAPVYDCDGNISAVITTVITQVLPGLAGRVRISTAWGSPNVLSVPVQALEDYSEAR